MFPPICFHVCGIQKYILQIVFYDTIRKIAQKYTLFHIFGMKKIASWTKRRRNSANPVMSCKINMRLPHPIVAGSVRRVICCFCRGGKCS